MGDVVDRQAHPRLGHSGVHPTMRPNKARLCVPVSPDDGPAAESKHATPSDEHIRFPGFNSPTDNNSPRFPSEQGDMRMKYNPDEDENYLSESDDDQPAPRSPVSSSVLLPVFVSFNSHPHLLIGVDVLDQSLK